MAILFCKGPSAQVQLKSLSHLHQINYMFVGCQIRLQAIYMQIKFGVLLITIQFPTPVHPLLFSGSVLNHLFQSFYYFAIVEDFILRFAWAYSYALIKANYVSEDLMTSINSPLEVFRYVINYLLLISMRCVG